MVDDGDLARIEPLADVLRPAVHARDGDNSGRLPGLAAEHRWNHGRQLHRVPSCQSAQAPTVTLTLTACHSPGDRSLSPCTQGARKKYHPNLGAGREAARKNI